MRIRWIVLVALVTVLAVLFGACGARTGLPLPDERRSEAGGGEGGGGSGLGGEPLGGQPVVGGGGEGGVGGAPPPDCDPETTQYIYLVTDEAQLFSFNPGTGFVHDIDFLECPNFNGATPFSMGVDRQGTAYVVYNDGNLYRVSTADASCEETDFTPGQDGFVTFGMGFALDELGGKKDKLYVAEISFDFPSLGLATIDTETLDLQFIGPFSDNPGNSIEMTSSSDGNLYGFFLDVGGNGGWVVEIDKNDATILSQTFVAAGDGGGALAFAWWGGDFYVFTAPGGGDTTVTRFDPETGQAGVFTTFAGRSVVGAGVSTCAPGQLP